MNHAYVGAVTTAEKQSTADRNYTLKGERQKVKSFNDLVRSLNDFVKSLNDSVKSLNDLVKSFKDLSLCHSQTYVCLRAGPRLSTGRPRSVYGNTFHKL